MVNARSGSLSTSGREEIRVDVRGQNVSETCGIHRHSQLINIIHDQRRAERIRFASAGGWQRKGEPHRVDPSVDQPRRNSCKEIRKIKMRIPSALQVSKRVLGSVLAPRTGGAVAPPVRSISASLLRLASQRMQVPTMGDSITEVR